MSIMHDGIEFEEVSVFDHFSAGECEIHLEGYDKNGNKYMASGYKDCVGNIEIYEDSVDCIIKTKRG